MKRFFFVVVIIVFALAFSACAQSYDITASQDEKKINPPDTPAKNTENLVGREYMIFTGSMEEDSYIDNLKELEQKSSIIVSGEVINKRQVMFYDDDFPPTGITVSTLKIDNIIKTDNKVIKESSLDFLEYYWIEERNGIEKVYTYDYYVPTNIGEKYLLFLSDIASTDYENPAKYTPTVLWMGKYPLTKNLFETYNTKGINANELQKNYEINGVPENYIKVLGEIMNQKNYNQLWNKLED